MSQIEVCHRHSLILVPQHVKSFSGILLWSGQENNLGPFVHPLVQFNTGPQMLVSLQQKTLEILLLILLAS